MLKSLIISIVLGTMLTSCYFVNDIFDPPEEKEASLQERSQQSVTQYLLQTTEDEEYTSYGFGNLTIRKPEEILKLEKMEAEYKNQPTPELDSNIARQKRYIKEFNIERTIDLDHFFTLKDSLGKLKIYETNFILNDTLGVKDLSANILIHISDEYEDALTYFFYEYNIFNTPSYYESRTLSSNFYAFFKEELEKREGRIEKSAFLLHVIKMTYQVKSKGSFNQQEILEYLVEEHIQQKRTDISDYKSVEFSNLFQSQEEGEEEVNGYYFFHKFIGSFQNQLDTNVILIEFSKYYEIDKIYQMDRPFDPYFNE